MNKVTSADGTSIGYQRFGGADPVVVLIGGALCGKEATQPLAEELATRVTVINYDRRGRGDSGDATPYAVDREIEDLSALIAEAGGAAAVYGHSSGAALALHAAVSGLPITRLVLHEPPFVAGADPDQEKAHIERIRDLVGRGRRADAVDLHLMSTGMPAEMVAGMHTGPWWQWMEANAHTLPYDFEIVSAAGETAADLANRLTMPTLLLAGAVSPPWMIDVARQLAEAAPHGQHKVLEGQGHMVPPDVLAPALATFLAA